MVIDYKNRTIIIADGISGDGQKTVSINYDRFDKVTYTKDQSGSFVYMDGSEYTPSVLPEGNSLEPGKFTNWNPTSSNVSFYYPINPDYTSGDTYANQLYFAPLYPIPSEYLNKLVITNDAGLSVVSIQGGPEANLGNGEYSITFNDDIPVGTIMTLSGVIYNMAYEATQLTPYTIEKELL